uniref:DUF3800 domain-containing protein n=1 Tax=Aliivibrio wodanis TaxID=80852 RepID=A0A5Q4ZY49_9GAMM|nr:hypothetical protein [Aliivibrio wodanis]VVV06787.1 hypothetical protein AW0309160_04281 [Aliivibrio wodanis]
MSVEQNLARYTLFYDESNNIRKFLLSGKEYNIDGDPNQRPSPNFILAGIAFQEESKDLDFDKLKSSLYLPNPDEELKFAQMVKIRAKYTPIEAFKYALGNKRFTTLFEYFVKNDVLIHYHMINTVYWSFLDIIEDIVLCTNEGIDYQEQFIYKDCLYRLIKIDKDGFLTLMDKYTYPHIRDDLSLEFLKELNELIMKNLALLFDVEDDGLNARMLIKLGFLVHKCIELYPEEPNLS